jgi:hypothetical protein
MDSFGLEVQAFKQCLSEIFATNRRLRGKTLIDLRLYDDAERMDRQSSHAEEHRGTRRERPDVVLRTQGTV